jgi:hypothetical protein
MPESQWPELSDTEWAARQVQLALADGRFRLAAGFANLAHRAQLAAEVEAQPDPVMVPMAGQTRTELPRMAMEASIELDARIHDQLAAQTTEAAAPDPFVLADARAAQAELFGVHPDATAGIPSPSPQRCRYQYLVQGATEECHAGIYWQRGQTGDASTPAIAAAWLHVDDRLDQDHRAVPHGSNSSV